MSNEIEIALSPPYDEDKPAKLESESERHAREYVEYKNKQALQNHLINNDRNRDLTSAEAVHVQTMLPKSVSMQYLDVPGVNQMHKDMGMEPDLQTDPKSYHKAKAKLFGKQPMRRLPIDSLTLTQTHVHKGRVGEMQSSPETLNEPVQVIQGSRGNFLMDGHHRLMARQRSGKQFVQARVYKPAEKHAEDDSEKHFGNPNHYPAGSSKGGEFAPAKGARGPNAGAEKGKAKIVKSEGTGKLKIKNSEIEDAFAVKGYSTDLSLIASATSSAINIDGIVRDGDTQIAKFSRSLYFNDKVASHDNFYIEPEYQGKGIAKSLLASSVKLYDKLGFKSVETIADGQKGIGKYAWAMYGFNWSRSEGAMVVQNFKNHLQRMGAAQATLDRAGQIRNAWQLAAFKVGTDKIGKEYMMTRMNAWEGSLNLSKGSTGRKIFDAYVNG